MPDDPIKFHLDRLKEAILGEGVSVRELGKIGASALVTNAFAQGAVREPIFGREGVIARESLIRPGTKTYKFSVGDLSLEFYKKRLHVDFDLLTCAIGLQHVKKFPVTLNISVESALTPTFWQQIEEYIAHRAPQDIIFEILEHEVSPSVDISHLEDLKERGYRFALDDYSVGSGHVNRLLAFGDLVDYVKIDGKLVRAGLGDNDTKFTPEDFDSVIAQIRDHAPHTQLVAEFVETREEADRLFEMGFAGVQGRALKEEDFEYATVTQSLAKDDPSCDHH